MDTPVKSVKKAFDLFSVIIFEDPAAQGLGLTELANRMAMPANSARNLLKSIISAGYLAQSEHGKYIAGPKSQAMLRGLVYSGPLQRLVELNVRNLSTRLNESVVFATLANGRRQLVAMADPDRSIKVESSRLLNPNPWKYITGRLLLAYADPAQLRETVATFGMPADKWDQINDLASLEQALSRIRQQGFCRAANDQDEIFSFACPVFGESGDFLGVMGCFAPQFRTLAEHIDNIETQMRDNALVLGRLISEGSGQ